MASSSPLPELPPEPHQPHSIQFPKRAYGKKKIVCCSFHPHLFVTWPFLHYNESDDAVYCHTCVKAFRFFIIGRMQTMSFRKHQDSKTHAEAVEAVIMLPKTTSNVGEL